MAGRVVNGCMVKDQNAGISPEALRMVLKRSVVLAFFHMSPTSYRLMSGVAVYCFFFL